MTPLISISVVSHLQGGLVAKLLADIERNCKNESLEVILTLNLPEALLLPEREFSYPLKIIHNRIALGFGENHNQAFQQSSGKYFCVVNPDILFDKDPFSPLLDCLKDLSIGVASPLVLNEHGEPEDSARRFPTPLKILCKAFGGCKGSDYVLKEETVFSDWIAGMFMLFPSEVFAKLNGFDQRYFLYYEDVDLCGRLMLQGFRVAVCPTAKVIHLARRDSRRRLKYLKWHLTSMTTYFFSGVFLKIFWGRLRHNIFDTSCNTKI
jgi:GT2 family glycosyltransferase